MSIKALTNSTKFVFYSSLRSSNKNKAFLFHFVFHAISNFKSLLLFGFIPTNSNFNDLFHFNLENISTLDISTVLAISFFVLKLFPYILFDDEIKLTNFFTYVLPTEYRKKAYLHFKLLLTNI